MFLSRVLMTALPLCLITQVSQGMEVELENNSLKRKGFFTELSMEDHRDLSNLNRLDLENNTAITDDDLSRLTTLTSLDLSSNETITDNSLSLLTNLTKLNLHNNYTISDKSVCCLPNLEELDLSVYLEYRFARKTVTQHPIKLDVLGVLPKLKKLTISKERDDTGKCIYFPGLEVYFNDSFFPPNSIQQALHIADALFSYVENGLGQVNNPEIISLKSEYQKSILWANKTYGHTSRYLNEDTEFRFTKAQLQHFLYTFVDIEDGDACPEYEKNLANVIDKLLKYCNINIKFYGLDCDNEYKDMFDMSVNDEKEDLG